MSNTKQTSYIKVKKKKNISRGPILQGQPRSNYFFFINLTHSEKDFLECLKNVPDIRNSSKEKNVSCYNGQYSGRKPKLRIYYFHPFHVFLTSVHQLHTTIFLLNLTEFLKFVVVDYWEKDQEKTHFVRILTVASVTVRG